MPGRMRPPNAAMLWTNETDGATKDAYNKATGPNGPMPGAWACNECGEHKLSKGKIKERHWRCLHCVYDICPQCAPERVPEID